MTVSSQIADKAVRHLRNADPRLRIVIDAAGPFCLRPEANRFRMLVRSILSQQLSSAAARTIKNRVEALVPNGRITAQAVSKLTLNQLRTAGVSNQKSAYLKDLAAHVTSRKLDLHKIGRHDDEKVIGALIQVKGIGRWTAQMFLIFALGRLNVFPEEDSGVRSAMRRIYGVSDDCDKNVYRALAETWHPYASVGSWYCWRAIDLKLISSPKDQFQDVA